MIIRINSRNAFIRYISSDIFELICKLIISNFIFQNIKTYFPKTVKKSKKLLDSGRKNINNFINIYAFLFSALHVFYTQFISCYFFIADNDNPGDF